MASIVGILLVCGLTMATGMSYVTTMTQTANPPACGSWTPYGDEKCIHIVDSALFQTKEEAEVVCQSLAEHMDLDDVPRLVTVRAENEQQILQEYLFEEVGLLEPVWIGLNRDDDGVFRWNNGLEMQFNNLARQNVSDADRPCIQMESGQGVFPIGLWTRVNCRKRNVVVCEKLQVWPLAKLQNKLMNLKSRIDRPTKTQHSLQGQNLGRKSPDLYTHTSPCGDWVAFKAEKCIKVFDLAGLQTKQDAETFCNSLHANQNPDERSKIITINNEEKQRFLQELLFDKRNLLDNVWMGLALEKDGNYKWNDGSGLLYANWAEESVGDKDKSCVQMESGEGPYKTGTWIKASCNKRNAVICEKGQPMTIENMLLSMKTEMEKNKQKTENMEMELEQNRADKANMRLEIEKYKQQFANIQQKLEKTNQDAVPIGFVYLQLSSVQLPPSSLWPDAVWEDISSSFAGRFFRVVGGNAGRFGDIQEENSPRLTQVIYEKGYDENPITISANNAWSRRIYSGSDKGDHWGLRLKVSAGEVRPRNQAIKVWQRIK